MTTTYRRMLEGLVKCWDRALAANFELGRRIDLVHRRYARVHGYRALARDLARMGRRISADSLRCHHKAYQPVVKVGLGFQKPRSQARHRGSERPNRTSATGCYRLRCAVPATIT